MNLILLDEEREGKETYELAACDSRAKHIRKHLKKREGSLVRVGFLGGGRIGQAEVRYRSGGDDVTLRVLPETLRSPNRRPLVHVLIGTPFPKTAKALWPVLASLGVAFVTYAPAALSEPDYAKSSVFEPRVYKPLLREGLAQAEDTRLPVVDVRDDFAAALAALPTDDRWCRLALHVVECGSNTPAAKSSIRRRFLDWRQQQQSSSSRRRRVSASSSAEDDEEEAAAILLAIGPERGWTDDELRALAAHRFLFASLGDPILRTDTAVVAALALARDVLLDDEEAGGDSRRPRHDDDAAAVVVQ